MDAFNVAGRGEMHLSILVETIRREGYEFQMSHPRGLFGCLFVFLLNPINSTVIPLVTKDG